MSAIVAFVAGVGLFSVYLATRCAFRVAEGHVAVRVSFGATETGGDGRLLLCGPGLHPKAPWQEVIDVSLKEQTVDLSGESGGQTAMAEDGTILRFDSMLRYQPRSELLPEFLFGMRKPLEHVTALFSCLLRNEIANFRPADGEHPSVDPHAAHAGSYSLIRTERGRLNRSIERFAKETIGHRCGIQFNAVDLVDILPPDELAEALNAVMQARTEAEAAYFRAQGESQQRALSAGEGLEIARARASALETGVDVMARHLRTLADAGTLQVYVERRRAEVLSEARTSYVRDEVSL